MPEAPRREHSAPVAVTPPEGTVMFGRAYNSFGLTEMLQGKVRAHPRVVGDYTEVDGTFLAFNPTYIFVQVGRQDLSASDINKIGELARALAKNYAVRKYLHTISETTSRTVWELGALEDLPIAASGERNKQAFEKGTKTLGNATGITPDMLKGKQEALEKEREALNQEAHEIGVAIFDSPNAWNHIVTPPKQPETPS